MFSHCSSSEHTPGIRSAKVSPSDRHILQTQLQIQNITPGKRQKVAKENQEIFDYVKKNVKQRNVGNSVHLKTNFLLLLLQESPLAFPSWWIPEQSPELAARAVSQQVPDATNHSPVRLGWREVKFRPWTLQAEGIGSVERLLHPTHDFFWEGPASIIENAILLFGPPGIQTSPNFICLPQKHFVMWFKRKSLIQTLLFHFQTVLLAKAMQASLHPTPLN